MDGLNIKSLMGEQTTKIAYRVDSLNAKSPTGVDQSRLRVDDLYTKSPTGGQTTKVDE